MTVDRTLTKPGHRDHWHNRQMLPVYDSGSETGNVVLTMDHAMRELWLSNDSDTATITVNIAGEASQSLNLVLLAGEVLNERFYEFTSVTVTSSGSWRYYVRSGLVP